MYLKMTQHLALGFLGSSIWLIFDKISARFRRISMNFTVLRLFSRQMLSVQILPTMRGPVLYSTIPTVIIRVSERVLHCYMYTIALNKDVARIASSCTGR